LNLSNKKHFEKFSIFRDFSSEIITQFGVFIQELISDKDCE